MNDSDSLRPSEWEIDNLPNRLTLFRVLLIPVILFGLSYQMIKGQRDAHYIAFGYLAAWSFGAAAITDFLDGYIARKKGIVTVFGSFIDPVADKFLVISYLIMLQALNRIHPLIIVVLVLREVYITSLRLLARERDLHIPSGKWGKWKTAFQMIGIPFLMPDDHPWGLPMPEVAISLIYITTFLSLFSALQYSIGLIRRLKIMKAKAFRRKNNIGTGTNNE